MQMWKSASIVFFQGLLSQSSKKNEGGVEGSLSPGRGPFSSVLTVIYVEVSGFISGLQLIVLRFFSTRLVE